MSESVYTCYDLPLRLHTQERGRAAGVLFVCCRAVRMTRKVLSDKEIRDLLRPTSYSISEGDEFEGCSDEKYVPPFKHSV